MLQGWVELHHRYVFLHLFSFFMLKVLLTIENTSFALDKIYYLTGWDQLYNQSNHGLKNVWSVEIVTTSFESSLLECLDLIEKYWRFIRLVFFSLGLSKDSRLWLVEYLYECLSEYWGKWIWSLTWDPSCSWPQMGDVHGSFHTEPPQKTTYQPNNCTP